MATTDPRRGQIWVVHLDPTVGSEIKKSRPCVVISSDTFARVPVRLVVPLTDWKDAKFGGRPWVVRVEPSELNQLDKVVAADPIQTRCVSTDSDRFARYVGNLEPDLVEEVVSGFAIVTEAK